jgi:2-keto-4-pentenoate hydratase/2-oxohepta-3-ene-1,7-dioic acid hydratase in catechol pathway
MKLVTFRNPLGPERVGALLDETTVLDLAVAAELLDGQSPQAFAAMQNFIDNGAAALELAARLMAAAPEDAVLSRSSVQVRAPLPAPRKIRDFSCFEKHIMQAAEGAARFLVAQSSDPEGEYQRIQREHGLDRMPPPGWYELPVYYYSDVTTVVGSDVAVHWPTYSDWVDYEVELAAVIGPGGKDIERANALEHVFGYTIFNDLSARDAQLKAMGTGMGPAKGKDFDGSNVMGPCIVTADEIDPYELTMTAKVNGQQLSRGHSSEMFWRFEDCIQYAAQSQTIHPGEIFCSGTVGNGSAIELGRSIGRGDIVEVEITGIGVLRTSIA